MSAAPPPGWYPEGPHLRWWDGARWGPYAPVAPQAPQTVEDRGKTLAVLSHLGCIASFIAPLVVYLIERNKPDRNEFACHHACEGLNFQITFLLVYLLGIGSFVAAVLVADGGGSDSAPAWVGLGIGMFWLLAMASMVANYVFSILAAVRAGNGVWWRYPVAIRLVGRGRDWHAEAVASGQLVGS